MTFPEFLAHYSAKFQNQYLVDHIVQMIADGRDTEDDVTIEIDKFRQLKQSGNIVDIGLGWSCSDLLTYMMEDWKKYQQNSIL